MSLSTQLLRSVASLALAMALVLSACDNAEPTPTDTTPPSASSANSNGSSAVIVFDEAVDPSSVSPSNFTVTPGPVAVSSAVASGSQVTVTFGSTLSEDERVTYTIAISGIRDTAGNTLSSGSVTFSYGNGGGGGGNASQEIGAAYPNAGDSRIALFNTDGDRFLLFNPSSGAVSDADDIDDVENGLIPLDNVGASASIYSDEETYFFALDGDTFSNYERDNSDFDAPASFEEEYDDSGYDLSGIGAAIGSSGERVILFNQNGTEWQEWYTDSDGFTNVFSFPADFGDGSSPISSVGAGFYVEEDDEIYLFNRQGTQYTIYANGTFTAAFPISELGDLEF